jgi:hypothetical protein
MNEASIACAYATQHRSDAWQELRLHRAAPEGREQAQFALHRGASEGREQAQFAPLVASRAEAQLTDANATIGLLRFHPPPARSFHALTSSVMIGRSPPCEIVIVSDLVSRRHALMEQLDSRWRIRDLDSENGVFVNGERVRSRVLRDGDVIRIGSSLLRFGHLIAKRRASIPPEEIPARVRQLLAGRGIDRQLSVEAMEKLCCTSWPEAGDELERMLLHAVERAPAGAWLDLQHFPDQNASDSAAIAELLSRHRGDVAAAAAALGISRSQLYRRAQKLRIRVASYRK